jgi:hypothetical protein
MCPSAAPTKMLLCEVSWPRCASPTLIEFVQIHRAFTAEPKDSSLDSPSSTIQVTAKFKVGNQFYARQ